MSTAMAQNVFTLKSQSSLEMSAEPDLEEELDISDLSNPPSLTTISGKTPNLVRVERRYPVESVESTNETGIETATVSAFINQVPWFSGRTSTLKASDWADWQLAYLPNPLHGSELPQRLKSHNLFNWAKPQFPTNQADIDESIRESQEMLDWEEDWDGEGSPRFQLQTWQQATEFVRMNSAQLWRKYNRVVPAPQFLPVGDGSIDIEWQVAERTLIVTVPPDPKEPALFYGHDAEKRNVIKGSLEVSANNEWLFMWALA